MEIYIIHEYKFHTRSNPGYKLRVTYPICLIKNLKMKKKTPFDKLELIYTLRLYVFNLCR